MREALYHPDHGYYTRHIRGVGHRGDFSTSATLSPVLGKAVARWIEQETQYWSAQDLGGEEKGKGRKAAWPLIEIGAGTGALAFSVLKALPFWRRWRTAYHIVEASPVLREQQQALLKRFGNRVRWHERVEDALEECQGRALIFSNELVDAFPILAVSWNEEAKRWDEIFVRWEESGGVWEELVPLAESRPEVAKTDSTLFPLGPEFQAGQRGEVHLSYRGWWSRWSSQVKAGSLLTIDYGGSPVELYERRPKGTLRAYHHHEREPASRLYRRFGRQDLTADVNFEDLENWGRELGWIAARYCSQKDFIETYLPDAGKQPTDRQAAFLLHEDGAGNAFRVLHQRKAE